jgi:hypothetical protein
MVVLQEVMVLISVVMTRYNEEFGQHSGVFLGAALIHYFLTAPVRMRAESTGQNIMSTFKTVEMKGTRRDDDEWDDGEYGYHAGAYMQFSFTRKPVRHGDVVVVRGVSAIGFPCHVGYGTAWKGSIVMCAHMATLSRIEVNGEDLHLNIIDNPRDLATYGRGTVQLQEVVAGNCVRMLVSGRYWFNMLWPQWNPEIQATRNRVHHVKNGVAYIEGLKSVRGDSGLPVLMETPEGVKLVGASGKFFGLKDEHQIEKVGCVLGGEATHTNVTVRTTHASSFQESMVERTMRMPGMAAGSTAGTLEILGGPCGSGKTYTIIPKILRNRPHGSAAIVVGPNRVVAREIHKSLLAQQDVGKVSLEISGAINHHSYSAKIKVMAHATLLK